MKHGLLRACRAGEEQGGRKWIVWLVLLLALMLPAQLPAASVTLSPVVDAYVNDSNPGGIHNNGLLVAGRSPAEFTPRYRSFLRFDLAGVPANAVIHSAVLRLNLQAFEGTPPATIEVRRALAPWTAGTLTWNNQPATAAPITSTPIGNVIGLNYQWSITSLVQSWVTGQAPNYGLELQIVGEPTAVLTRTFASGDNVNAGLRPQLVVTYTQYPDIAISPAALAFEIQRIGTTSTVQNVTVLNNGGATLWISNITSSGSSGSASPFQVLGTPPLPAALSPGSSGIFQVRFAPTSTGTKAGTINITSNDPDEATVALSCTGTGVVPDIDVAPAALMFANQRLGTASVPQTITIKNTGSADLRISGINKSSGEFAVMPGSALPATIAPGSNFLFGVSFTPTSTGLKNGSVTVLSDDPDEGTRTVTCSGTGVVPNVELLPRELRFANQRVGSGSSTQMVTLRNSGSWPSRIDNIQSMRSEFVVSLGVSFPVTIAPGSNLTFGVAFVPTNGGLKGTFVKVFGDGAPYGVHWLPCSGLAIPDLPRSTFYDGSTGAVVRFTHLPLIDSNTMMTAEAWVRREDTNRTEAIIVGRRSMSFWFGFAGPRLRFHRTSGQFADSTGTVTGQRWTHVAAVCNGSTVEFYIDGEPAGVNLAGDYAGSNADTVQLGGDDQGANFRGYLDDVRLWRYSRSAEQIRKGMLDLEQPPSEMDAYFPSGGGWEALKGLPGEVGPGAFGKNLGIMLGSLHIPRALFPDTLVVDGYVDLNSEYLGAEEVVIRYDEGPDAIAHLIYRSDSRGDDPALFIGVTGLRPIPAGRDPAESYVAVMVDNNLSQNEAPNVLDLQLRGYLGGIGEAASALWLGDGAGFMFFESLRNQQDFSAKRGAVWNEFGTADSMELRIAGRQLGRWAETDGFAFGHFGVEADGDDYPAPAGARVNSPMTWAPADYVNNETAAARVFVTVVVEDGYGNRFGGKEVQLLDQHGGLLTSATPQSGSITFAGTAVPPLQELQVRVVPCAGCRGLTPVVEEINRAPIRTEDSSVVYLIGAARDYTLANVTFRMMEPPGPVVLDSFFPQTGTAALILREEPLKQLTGTTVRLRGANLHDLIQVYFDSCNELNEMNGPSCAEGVGYFEARILDRAADGTWVDVEVPHVPRASWHPDFGGWGWAVKDNWNRPERQGIWTRVGGDGVSQFELHFEYPQVFGFEFPNEAYKVSVNDYSATFGNNTYSMCVKSPFDDDTCWCAETSPGFFSLIFKPLIDDGEGSCVGMAAASQLLARNEPDGLQVTMPGLNSDAAASGINFSAGFTDQGIPVFRQPDCDDPARPQNLRARIRALHGMQFSVEFLDAAIQQMTGDLSISARPVSAFNDIADHVDRYIICMVPVLGQVGHCVTPYAVERQTQLDGSFSATTHLIHVYDSNFPENTTRVIEIFEHVAGDGFPNGSYRFQFSAGETWVGDGLYAMPISVFHGEHHPPTALDAVWLALEIVLGNADVLHRDGKGGEAGWRADGSVVDKLPGARALMPLGAGDRLTRRVPFILPVTNLPAVQINARGPNYTYLLANGGRRLDLERRDAREGDQDQVMLQTEAGRIIGLRFAPQRVASDWNVRAILPPSAQEPMMLDLSGVTVPAGAAAEVRLAADGRGLEFRNATGLPARPILTIVSQNVSSLLMETNQYGPFDVPAGAIQRVTLSEWPSITHVRSEVDANGDGVAEWVQVVGRNADTKLDIGRDTGSGRIRISWPTGAGGFVLEETSTLNGVANAWTRVPPPYETNANRIAITLPETAPRFYRLRKLD